MLVVVVVNCFGRRVSAGFTCPACSLDVLVKRLLRSPSAASAANQSIVAIVVPTRFVKCVSSRVAAMSVRNAVRGVFGSPGTFRSLSSSRVDTRRVVAVSNVQPTMIAYVL